MGGGKEGLKGGRKGILEKGTTRMERIGGMVWDGDGCKKERDTTCEIVDQSAVCVMLLCCASKSTQ